MEHALSSATLTELRRPRPYPAVSVLTPTHRREPENAQDPVRLRNVLARAKKQLEHDPAVTRDAIHVPHGGLTHGTPEAVWQAVRPMVAAEDRRNVDAVARRLEAARGQKAFAAGVDEVRQNAEQGRIELLAVEENYRTTVRADGGPHLVPAESGDLDARDDIVDEIVEQCLDTGAEVRFVPDGTLGDARGIAGVLRY
jgi:peptide subunit release factor 1 (eRF1)